MKAQKRGISGRTERILVSDSLGTDVLGTAPLAGAGLPVLDSCFGVCLLGPHKADVPYCWVVGSAREASRAKETGAEKARESGRGPASLCPVSPVTPAIVGRSRALGSRAVGVQPRALWPYHTWLSARASAKARICPQLGALYGAGDEGTTVTRQDPACVAGLRR